MSEISQSEIEKIDREVDAKLANDVKKSNEELAKKIREDVEKEFRAKSELDSLKEQQKKMQEELDKAKAEAVKAREDAEKNSKELQESLRKQLEEVLAQKKGITMGNQSPFQSQPVGPNVRVLPDGRKIDVSQLTPQEHKDIEEASRQAMMDFLGIRDQTARSEWGVDPRDKYK